MERTDVNPWEWSKAFGFSQAVGVSNASRVLVCSGQTAIADDGSPPTTADMAKQMELALSNLTTVLGAAGMTMADVVKLTVYTTDVDELLASYGSATQFLGDGQSKVDTFTVASMYAAHLRSLTSGSRSIGCAGVVRFRHR